ncbi:MAG: thrombospondin type 3 repeat-containing protein, partial [Saprospiraceae bacterium]
MKKVALILFIAFFVSSSIQLNAQNEKYPLGITFKALLMDYQSQNGGSFGNLNDYHHGFEVAFSKNLQDRLNLVIPLKVGVVNATAYDPNRFDQGRCLHKTVYGLDALLQYQFYKEEKQVVPFVKGGLGLVSEKGGDLNLQVPLGGGVQIKIAPNAYAIIESEYRISFSENRNNLHHGLGFVYLIGDGLPVKKEIKEIKLDTDGDGVFDEVDLCPDIIGLAVLNGCPDTDGDGIADHLDSCPTIFGLEAFKGCPDTDGDGIVDSEDNCPKIAGTIDNKGCPNSDRDNDGVLDSEDRCPDLAGIAANGGCPGGDRDNDGISDNVDACPDVWGAISANGCPDRDGDGITDTKD